MPLRCGDAARVKTTKKRPERTSPLRRASPQPLPATRPLSGRGASPAALPTRGRHAQHLRGDAARRCAAPRFAGDARSDVRRARRATVSRRANPTPPLPSQNDQGQPVDLYIPRKCSWTNRLIEAFDKASVQINVGSIDANTGLYTNTYKTYALSGYVRNKGESDMALTDLVRKSDEAL